MKKILATIALSLLVVGFISSQDINLKDEVIRINGIKDADAKIQALNDIATRLQAQASPDYVTQWNVQKIDDKMNNRTVYLISVEDKNNPGFNLTIQYVKNLRESQDSATLFMDNIDWHFNSGVQPVDYQFGDGPVVFHEKWAYAKDNKQLVISFPDKMLANIAANDEVTVSFVAGYHDEKTTRLFEVYGLKKAISQYDIDFQRILELSKKAK